MLRRFWLLYLVLQTLMLPAGAVGLLKGGVSYESPSQLQEFEHALRTDKELE